MKELLQKLASACRYGATRYTRIKWLLGPKTGQYPALLAARVLEEHGPVQIDPWVSMTPFGVDLARNWDRLVKTSCDPAEGKNMNKKRNKKRNKKTVKVKCLSMSELVWGKDKS
jgi:hypothetical protein